MSGLHHLLEAATALTNLYPTSSFHQNSNNPSSLVMSTLPTTNASQPTIADAFPPSSSSSSRYSRRSSTHTISDDDTLCTATSKIGDHLQALRAAAAAAGLAVPPPVQPTTEEYRMTPPTQATTTTTKTTIGGGESNTTKEIFPMRLQAVLADSSVRDAIAWLPHGKSFVVIRADVFATSVLPRYFATATEGTLKSGVNAKMTSTKMSSASVHKYPSFTRKLNRWGFKQISRGPDAGAFYHELFKRDDPELCRGMVCQKSRKSRNPTKNGGGSGSVSSDDMMSVSSACTMGTKSVTSCEKRPYSSTVTVSTAGVSSSNIRNLPFKKRKSHNMNGIPSVISHGYQEMASSTTAMTASDSSGDIPSSSNNSSESVLLPPKPPQVNTANLYGMSNNTDTTAIGTSRESAAREALAHHFHEQHRAFALATLMENSRLAMEAAGMESPGASTSVATQQLQKQQASQDSSFVGAITTYSPMVVAPTVTSSNDVQATSISVADAAKTELYKAFMQAMSTSNDSICAQSS